MGCVSQLLSLKALVIWFEQLWFCNLHAQIAHLLKSIIVQACSIIFLRSSFQWVVDRKKSDRNCLGHIWSGTKKFGLFWKHVGKHFSWSLEVIFLQTILKIHMEVIFPFQYGGHFPLNFFENSYGGHFPLGHFPMEVTFMALKYLPSELFLKPNLLYLLEETKPWFFGHGICSLWRLCQFLKKLKPYKCYQEVWKRKYFVRRILNFLVLL